MNRHHFERDALKLSYLDAGGDGKPLIALHSHWLEGQTYAPLAAALAPDWRVIAPDQRGHGYSDHAKSYTRDDYLADLLALYEYLSLDSAMLLGNSLGGVNAYQFAARHPEKVTAMIIEDMDANVDDDTTMALKWAGTFPSREALEERIGPRFVPYLRDSFRESAGGWKMAFDPNDMVASQKALNGDHWSDWLASDCPTLLLHGAESKVTTQDQMEDMATRRPNTKLVTLPGSHVLHIDDPDGFLKAVKEFLQPFLN